MITAGIVLDELGIICKYESKGHAGESRFKTVFNTMCKKNYSHYLSVCGAVSAAEYQFIYSISALTDCNPQVAIKSGHCMITNFLYSPENTNVLKTLSASFIIGLESIHRNYAHQFALSVINHSKPYKK